MNDLDFTFIGGPFHGQRRYHDGIFLTMRTEAGQMFTYQRVAIKAAGSAKVYDLWMPNDAQDPVGYLIGLALKAPKP